MTACNESENDSNSNKEENVKKDSVIVKEPTIEYGFVLDSFIVKKGVVEEGQTMSHMMIPHGVDQNQCNVCYNKAKDSLISLNYIVPGHAYTALYNPNDTSHAAYIIYEKNKVDYVVFDLTQKDIKVTKKQKEVETVRKEVGGTISSSLWNTFMDLGISPEVLMRVVNTYQWSVDFFTIQPGDYFKLIYDERSVNGEAVSAGEIYAIELHTYDSSYYAIPFEAGDSIHGYFDIEGGSLRKALLKAPLDFIRVSSKFSKSRKHPVLGIYRPHYGVDYAAPFGTPVVSVGDGLITFAGWSGGAGNLIKIQHNDQILTMYMHLQKIHVRKGERVIQGQHIGDVGSTGLSTGPHLDYRININGKYVDPLSADIPTSEHLPSEYLDAFKVIADSARAQLSAIKITETE